MDESQEADSGAEYEDAEVDLQCVIEDAPEATPRAQSVSKTFDHPLYKGDKFEVRAGEHELGLVLTVPRGKRISVRFSVDRWETTEQVTGELLGSGAEDAHGRTDRVFFRIPVGRDAIRVSGTRGGVDFAVCYYDEESTV